MAVKRRGFIVAFNSSNEKRQQFVIRTPDGDVRASMNDILKGIPQAGCRCLFHDAIDDRGARAIEIEVLQPFPQARFLANDPIDVSQQQSGRVAPIVTPAPVSITTQDS